MRTKRLILRLAAALSAGLSSTDEAAPLQIHAQPIEMGISFTVPSSVLAGNRQINVWLPDGYATLTKRYPVVYLLDGATDQDFLHVAGLASLASLSWTFDPFILIGIQTRDRGAELTPLQPTRATGRPFPAPAVPVRSAASSARKSSLSWRADIGRTAIAL